MKLGLIGSLPPVKDGVADHNEFLFSALAKDLNIDTIRTYAGPESPKASEKNQFLNLSKLDELISSKPDVIHLQVGNSYHNSYVFDAYKRVKDKGPRIVITLHDNAKFSLAKLIRAVLERPLTLKHELTRPSFKAILGEADKVIVYSSYLARQLAALGVEENKIAIIHHGGRAYKNYDRDAIRKELQFSDSDFILSSFGFIAPRKGYETVIKSIAELNKAGIKVKYYILGDFNFPPYKHYLFRLTDKLGLKDQVIFPGYYPLAKAQDVLIASDAIIQPRRYSTEGISGSLVMALFAKTPVITVGIGGLAEYVKNEETALLVKHNEEGYAAAISKLYRDRSMRQRIGANAYEWAVKELSWPSIAAKHVDVYQNL